MYVQVCECECMCRCVCVRITINVIDVCGNVCEYSQCDSQCSCPPNCPSQNQFTAAHDSMFTLSGLIVGGEGL